MSNAYTPPHASTPTSPESKGRRGSRVLWLCLGITLILVTIGRIPKELVAWKYAAALEARDAGNEERAEKLFQEVIQKYPDDPFYRRAAYRWEFEHHRYDNALEYLDEQLKLRPKDPRLLLQRSQVYLHLKRYPEAIADARTVQQMANASGIMDPDEAANGVAYARALGRINLDLAVEGIEGPVRNARAELEEDLEQLQAEQAAGKVSFLSALLVAERKLRLAMVLDTRGFAELQRGNAERALQDLDEAVQLGDDNWHFLQKHERKFSSQKRLVREWEKELETRRQMLAVILYHRGLAYEKLGRAREAQHDFNRVRELIGKEPDESLF